MIYHGALRNFLETPDASLAEFEQTGKIKWASDLAEIPGKFGVKNVYGEIGTAFATAAVANPRFAAAFIGTLVKGLGADHVIWGSDSLWYARPSGRSRRCAVSRFPRTCRRSTASSRSADRMVP